LEIVFNALTSPIALPSGIVLGPLCKTPSAREMEFVFPIPEPTHALLGSRKDSGWVAEHGYLKGFVDFVFEHNGMHYFADWKSDFLSAYDRASLEPHVFEHYDLQARIYSVGIVRLLSVRDENDYERRFGGLLYLFLRGIKPQGGSDGIYFRRPDWREICQYEESLRHSIPAAYALP